MGINTNRKNARTYKKIHAELIKKVRRDYGPRCNTFDLNCLGCQNYMMLDILLDSAERAE